MVFFYLFHLVNNYVRNIFKTMCDHPWDPYKFKAFRFEEIQPNEMGVVPLPRSGHQIVADSKNMYVFGGYNPIVSNLRFDGEPDYPLLQEMWRFNFASREWTKYSHGQNLPRELVSNAAIRYKDLLMVYRCVRERGGVGFIYEEI